MQNIFVDPSIKICIAQEMRFFNFLGNSESRFFAVGPSHLSVGGVRRAAAGVKAFLKRHTDCFLCPDPDHPCNLQQLRCESDENGC